MSFSGWLHDKKAVLLVCFAGALFFSVLLWLFGLEIGEIFLLWLCFLFIAAGLLLWNYLSLRRRLLHFRAVMDELDRKYLFAEIMDVPTSEWEKVYFELMKTALKDMTDEVSQANRLSREYREFIEQWIHEMKVPITGIQLLCENNKSDAARKILTQTELISQGVERVLFYARLGNVEKDYLIKEVSLRACVMEVLAQNRQFLIQNNVCVHTERLSGTVYSDQKWLQFILNQIIINSVKYQSSQPLVIDVVSQEQENYIVLTITDNGIGIRESELGRVFDKGFVGSNGRAGKNSTGIGLYLCDQLCSRLGIGIEIKSRAGEYTTVLLHFPKSEFLKV
ncbi:MAG: sensor histidine kinase [Lachnospiraceae bacterium]|nr:sensor histidine kinase [Lachnospiraceae bacterium]